VSTSRCHSPISNNSIFGIVVDYVRHGGGDGDWLCIIVSGKVKLGATPRMSGRICTPFLAHQTCSASFRCSNPGPAARRRQQSPTCAERGWIDGSCWSGWPLIPRSGEAAANPRAVAARIDDDLADIIFTDVAARLASICCDWRNDSACKKTVRCASSTG
jgi:hypothetical protein